MADAAILAMAFSPVSGCMPTFSTIEKRCGRRANHNRFSDFNEPEERWRLNRE
jgi:hypothetical protein